MPLSVLGRPMVRREYVQWRVTRSRCQRRSVAGETNSVDHAERGSERLSAARAACQWPQSRPGDLTLKDMQLVAQHKNLELF
jgi:hypothetical protein